MLTRIKDPTLRAKLRDKAIKKNWSHRDLSQHIFQATGYGARRGGKTPRIRKFGLEVALRHLQDQSIGWSNRFSNEWSPLLLTIKSYQKKAKMLWPSHWQVSKKP